MFRRLVCRTVFEKLRCRPAWIATVTVSAILFPPTAWAVQRVEASQFYEWTAPRPEEQLARDPTLIPPGQSALFIPALTNGQDEPEVVVYLNDRRVTAGPTGRRIILAPGNYVVRIGSGPAPQMVAVSVETRTGETAVVPVNWGGLKVEVVDANNVPHRGTFELIRVTDRQPYTIGFGADTLVGERLRTLLLPPGLYRVVRPGANYRTRTDFSTVLIPEGGLVHYKLVLERSSGQFLGSGVVTREEIGEPMETSAWSNRYTLGVGLPISSTSNVVGATNETAIGGDLTFDIYLTYSRDEDYANIIFEIEEGFIRIKPQGAGALPVQKTRDRLRLDTLYTRFTNPRVGPYVRFGLVTSVFESRVRVTENTTLIQRLLDGTETVTPIRANQDFKTGRAFSPALFREGAGINVRLLRQRESFIDWRGGSGFRQNRFNQSFVQDTGALLSELLTGRPLPPIGTPSDPLIYTEFGSFNQWGLENTIVASASLGRFLINANFDLFGDFRSLGKPTIDLRNTFSWRLTGNLSLDYTVDILRLPQVTEKTQATQRLLFRYSWGS